MIGDFSFEYSLIIVTSGSLIFMFFSIAPCQKLVQHLQESRGNQISLNRIISFNSIFSIAPFQQQLDGSRDDDEEEESREEDQTCAAEKRLFSASFDNQILATSTLPLPVLVKYISHPE
jgi:hypothetical protein